VGGVASTDLKRAETIHAQSARMRAPFLVVAVFAACAAASGCVTAAVGAAASVGVYAMQDRTIGEGHDEAPPSKQKNNPSNPPPTKIKPAKPYTK
jgi:hypothetical protein